MYWYVCASYNSVYIVMFVHLIQYNCWLYFILGILSHVSTMYGLFFNCIFVKFTFVLICLWMLYIWLLWYVCVLHTICSLVALHLGNLVMHISCILFVVPLSPSLLTYIPNSGFTHLCLNWLSHALKHISLFLVAQYSKYLFLL